MSNPITELEQKLVEFAKWTLQQYNWLECDSVDRQLVQEKLESLGLLKLHVVYEPCGDECMCAEVSDPPFECYRPVEGLIPK